MIADVLAPFEALRKDFFDVAVPAATAAGVWRGDVEFERDQARHPISLIVLSHRTAGRARPVLLRHRPRHQRPAPDRAGTDRGKGGRRRGQQGQGRVPGDDEPRDPDAHERRSSERPNCCWTPSCRRSNGTSPSRSANRARPCSTSSTTSSTSPRSTPNRWSSRASGSNCARRSTRSAGVLGGAAAAQGSAAAASDRRRRAGQLLEGDPGRACARSSPTWWASGQVHRNGRGPGSGHRGPDRPADGRGQAPTSKSATRASASRRTAGAGSSSRSPRPTAR